MHGKWAKISKQCLQIIIIYKLSSKYRASQKTPYRTPPWLTAHTLCSRAQLNSIHLAVEIHTVMTQL